MKSPATMLAIAVLAITSLQVADGDNHARLPQDDLRLFAGPTEPEPPNTPVGIGDPAPDFSFETSDHSWHHLRDLLGQGGVLLIFAPTDAQLQALEADREGLLSRGIVPVAVVDRRDGAAWTMPRRLQLHFSVIGDSRGVIASQFNLADPTARRTIPGWFVVDRAGRVRGLRREALPVKGYLATATRALGLAAEDTAQPASAR